MHIYLLLFFTLVSLLKNKNLGQIINQWAQDLEADVKAFNTQAIKIGRYDRALLENSDKVC